MRLVTLTGPPGVGKTSLALHVAGALAQDQFSGEGGLEQFWDGILWVAMASVTDPELVMSTITRALDVQVLGEQKLLAALKQYLARKRLLLILDNFEQVVEAPPQLVELLAACQQIKLLVTSRESLHVRSEQEFNVRPLSTPNMAGLPTVESLADSPAVALFVQRAQAVDIHFALTDENAPVVAAICTRLDGLPLAIELLAVRAKILPVKALLARLQSVGGQSIHLNLLSGGARDVPERHKTLRDAISWSYDLLNSAEQLLFSRLGVFLGGFTLPPAEAVCNAASDLKLDLLDGISQLLNKNLIKREIEWERVGEAVGEDEEEARCTMLETIREYAVERLRASEEERELRLLHTEYFLALSSSSDLNVFGENAKKVYRQIDRNYDNLRAAITWTIESGRLDLAVQFGVALLRYWETRAQYAEGRDWLLRITSANAAPAALDHDA